MINWNRTLSTRRKFLFNPFQVPKAGVPLAPLPLPGDTELILFSRGNTKRTLIAREMAYHHVAQGELEGEPYLVSF